MGAFLHDVGKTEVPESILNKPGKLTEEERRAIELHPVTGDEMLSTIEFPWDIRPMVRWHHERWDGAGYPDRLVGEEIPLTARILRIADIFDALTTSRSYRRPLAAEDALKVMEEDTGSFDSKVFEVFRSLFQEFSGLVGGSSSESQEVCDVAASSEN
jgi:HD-GYP domain-containing protein (c-di-GMP phosphodiesterase class II)